MTDTDFRVVAVDYGSFDYGIFVKIREICLMRPFGLTLNDSDTAKDALSIILVGLKKDKMMSCCMLTPVDASTVALRQLGVLPFYRSNGYAKKLVKHAVALARNKGYREIVLDARYHLVDVYKQMGFHSLSPVVLIRKTGKHLVMRQKLH
jgi:predicted GNAT family N-acyltransferase